MPRKGRLHIAGGHYHVMGRGLERRRIFRSEHDKIDFLNRLETGLSETGCQCLAWAVMSNHYHLLIQVSTVPLSHLMSKLLSGYATNYNKRHGRSGYVFQNRYKSILCDENQYLLELVRYIHLNPVKARLLKSITQLDRYQWTGHANLLGLDDRPWQNTRAVLSYFGDTESQARQRYGRFVKEGLGKASDFELTGGGLIRSYGGWQGLLSLRAEHTLRIGDERILGESEFVERVLREDELNLEAKTRLLRLGWDMEKLIQHVCEHLSVDKSLLKHKGRENKLSKAKGLICYIGTHRLGLSTKAIALRLGMSQPAVSKAAKKAVHYLEEYRYVDIL